MNAAQTIQNEILALHRIQAYQEVFGYSFGPGMWEFDRFFTIELDEGGLRAVVDFYSQDFYRSHPDGNGEFDDAVMEGEEMRLSTPVTTRDEFRILHRICRCLLDGRTVVLADGKFASRDLHLALVREGGAA